MADFRLELGEIDVEDLGLLEANPLASEVSFTTQQFDARMGIMLGLKYQNVKIVETNLVIGEEGDQTGFVKALKEGAPRLQKIWLHGGECLTFGTVD